MTDGLPGSPRLLDGTAAWLRGNSKGGNRWIGSHLERIRKSAHGCARACQFGNGQNPRKGLYRYFGTTRIGLTTGRYPAPAPAEWLISAGPGRGRVSAGACLSWFWPGLGLSRSCLVRFLRRSWPGPRRSARRCSPEPRPCRPRGPSRSAPAARAPAVPRAARRGRRCPG